MLRHASSLFGALPLQPFGRDELLTAGLTTSVSTILTTFRLRGI